MYVGSIGDVHSVSNFNIPKTAVSVSHSGESVTGRDAGGEDVRGVFGVYLGLYRFPASVVDSFGCCRAVFRKGLVKVVVHVGKICACV